MEYDTGRSTIDKLIVYWSYGIEYDRPFDRPQCESQVRRCTVEDHSRGEANFVLSSGFLKLRDRVHTNP